MKKITRATYDYYFRQKKMAQKKFILIFFNPNKRYISKMILKNLLTFTLIVVWAFCVEASLSSPLYDNFEPTTEEKYYVLTEIFDALFTPTNVPSKCVSSHTIRNDIAKYFGYISRTGVDYIFARLGYVRGADTDEMIRLMGISHSPHAYRHYCSMTKKLQNALSKTNDLNEWLAIISASTGRDLPLTRQYILDHPALNGQNEF